MGIGASLLRSLPGVFAATALLPLPAPAQAAPGSLAPPARFADSGRVGKLRSAFAAVDELMRSFGANNNVPGMAWGIVVDGKLIHVGTAGYRELSSRAPVDSTSVFRIASMTKSFTALAILQLRDAGKLSLDDPAERYVPELKGLRYPDRKSVV